MTHSVSRLTTPSVQSRAAAAFRTGLARGEEKKRGEVETRSTDGDTRKQILMTLLKQGPMTASALGKTLGLSAAGVRRHLDILVDDALAETVEPRSSRGRGRGRPAKAFQLTDEGRAHFGHDYDTLAVLAITALRETGGSEAVREFARQRVAQLLAHVDPAADDEDSTYKTAQQVADALNASGYASEVKEAGGGVQICHHHCPISHVASEHPELCAAEYEVLSELLGQHVQQLATITEGHGICTTNIPLTPIDHTPEERS
ncbi:helix-turn-helix transcriptional regulator [Corynebacterium sp. 49B]|uniref:helix-turn-helix transcriptional regulator n=2 Tax=Corynebacteriaceae TaxID=1653 RepID=UPI00351A5919